MEGLDALATSGSLPATDACPTSAPSRGLDADRNGCTDTLDGLVGIVQGLSLASQLENGLLGKLDEVR